MSLNSLIYKWQDQWDKGSQVCNAGLPQNHGIVLCYARVMGRPRRWSLGLWGGQSPGPVTSGLEHPHPLPSSVPCAMTWKVSGSTSTVQSLAQRMHSVLVSSLYLLKECGALSGFLMPELGAPEMLWVLPYLGATLLKITKDLTMASVCHHTEDHAE